MLKQECAQRFGDLDVDLSASLQRVTETWMKTMLASDSWLKLGMSLNLALRTFELHSVVYSNSFLCESNVLTSVSI